MRYFIEWPIGVSCVDMFILRKQCAQVHLCISLRFNNMQRDGGKLKAMVDENQALLKVPEGSRHWDRYLLFLDNMITRGLVDAVSCRSVKTY